MSEDIRAGDVVVCVMLGDGNPEPWEPKVGGYYRVASVDYPTLECPWSTIDLVEDPFHKPDTAWPIEWFRKLDAAEDCFTKAMRELRPLETEPTFTPTQALTKLHADNRRIEALRRAVRGMREAG